MFKQLFHFFMNRFGLDLAADKILFRKVAKTSWYQGDGATMATLLAVQLLTGAVLSLSYSNSIDTAYQSIEFITYHKTMGWFIRGLHYWSAGLFVVMLVFHLLRHLLIAGYKTPREGTWWTGVLLFFLVIIMSYSGYVLRWDERAVYAVKILLNILNNIPYIGDELILFVQGGSEINSHTLTRFFSVHVILVPGILLLLVAYHLYLVIHQGTTSKIERRIPVETKEEHAEVYEAAKKSSSEGEEFFPTTMASSGIMSFVVLLFGIILTLTLGPAELYPEANLTTTSFPQEEWWFWWYSALIAILPPRSVPYFVVWFPILLFLFLISLPLLDRGPKRDMSQRPLWVIFVGLSVMTLIGLSALRMRSPWTGWPSQELPPFPKEYVATPDLIKGRKIFVQYGCNSCHAVAGTGPNVGPDITDFERLLTREDIINVITHPSPEIAMPSYKGRMTDEELKYVSEFVFVLQIQPRRK